MISAVAELYKLHPQTLRLYERVGLLKPSRSQGNTRLYTDSDLERLDVILTLARGYGREPGRHRNILNMREKMIEMERQMGEFAQVGATGIVAGGGFTHAGKTAAACDCAGDTAACPIVIGDR